MSVEIDPAMLARLRNVGSLEILIDDINELIDFLTSPATDSTAVLLHRAHVHRIAARIEDARVILARLCYPIPRDSFFDDPLAYFQSARGHFERVIPTLDLTADPDTEMFKANLAGRN